MAKYKSYTLYAKIEGSHNSKYTLEESLMDDAKRQQALMSGKLIEDLDRLTSKYESIEDLLSSYPEEVWDIAVKMYEPVIIVDKYETDRKKSYYITDIVFAGDAIELQKIDNIKRWLSEFLLNNPYLVEEFRGIREIFNNLTLSHNVNVEDLIDMTVYSYFKDNNYKKYREIYFKLKKLDYKRVKKNVLHR
jgi:hypothetical protein